MDHNKVFRLHTGEYVHVHQEDETQNTIDIYWSVRAIVLVPQYNLQGGYFFENILTEKRLRRSHWTPANMT